MFAFRLTAEIPLTCLWQWLWR